MNNLNDNKMEVDVNQVEDSKRYLIEALKTNVLVENELIVLKEEKGKPNSETINNLELQIKVNPENEKQVKLNTSKLYSILTHKKGVVFFAVLSSIIIGLAWPITGLLMGAGTDSLSSTDPDKVKNDSFFYAMLFILIAFVVGIGYFLQR